MREKHLGCLDGKRMQEKNISPTPTWKELQGGEKQTRKIIGKKRAALSKPTCMKKEFYA